MGYGHLSLACPTRSPCHVNHVINDAYLQFSACIGLARGGLMQRVEVKNSYYLSVWYECFFNLHDRNNLLSCHQADPP